MSMKPMVALALSLLCVVQVASATTSIWPPQATPESKLLGDYRAASCSMKPPAAYTGHLRLQSKYDQTDESKSHLNAEQDAQTQQIQAQVKRYIGGLLQASKTFEKARDVQDATLAIGCFDKWLDAWAEPGALLSTDATSTGHAGRKWALAAIAGSILRTQALSDGRFTLSSVQRDWLSRLGEQVIADYQPRHNPDFQYFNNHDYWAGWAVAATGMLLGRDDFLAWCDSNLRRGLEQMTTSAHGDYAYLPLEVARGKLAANYSQYALVPLMLLVESAEANGRGLSGEESQRLQRLANFSARTVLEPSGLVELDGQVQDKVEPYKMVWLIPFLSRYPNHTWAQNLYRAENGKVDSYSQIGGDIKAFYPSLQ